MHSNQFTEITNQLSKSSKALNLKDMHMQLAEVSEIA